MLEFILLYRKEIVYGIVAATIAGIIYWFGFHIPAKLKATQADIVQLQAQVQAGQEAITLLEDIQKGKAKIDDNTFRQISSVRGKIGKPHTILIPAGRLPMSPMRQTRSAP
jgi:hypothetical protein